MHKIKELKKRFVRRIACVSDLHCGSRYALWPVGVAMHDGMLYQQNQGQMELLKSWLDFCNKCNEWEVDSVFVLGDLVHGQDRKNMGMGLITTDLNVQAEAATILLRRLVNGNRKSYFVSGSQYHNSVEGMKVERVICDNLKGDWGNGIAHNLRINDRVFHLSHGGGGGVYYRETNQAREMVFAKVAEATGKLPRIDMFVHGHYHWYSHIDQINGHHLQLPCWTSWEPSTVFVKNYTRMQPDIGGALIFMDEQSRIMVWHMDYPLPHIADEVREG